MPYYNIMCIVLCVEKRPREREKIIQSQNDKTHINNIRLQSVHTEQNKGKIKNTRNTLT